MIQKDKDLLLKDLCARIPYRVICNDSRHGDSRITEIDVVEKTVYCYDFDEYAELGKIKPYLRPMSNMTEEEIVELKWLNEKCDAMPTFEYVPVENYRIYDWMNRHHFDFRNLIEKGLALEAPSDMYNIKEK